MMYNINKTNYVYGIYERYSEFKKNDSLGENNPNSTDPEYRNMTRTDIERWCSTSGLTEEFLTTPLFHACVYFMYGTVFIVALAGNGLVCFVVQTSPRMKTVTNLFIVNLAVGDILTTMFCVPFSFVSMLVLRYWPFGVTMCKAVNYLQAVSVLVSSYTMLAISIDRYIVIMIPLRPRLGKAIAKFVVAAVWGGALLTAAPIPFVSTLQRPTEWYTFCQADLCLEQWEWVAQSSQYTCALMLLQFALPLAALVCTYARIAHALWGGRPPGEPQSDRDARMQCSKRKMIKMMVIIVAVYIICWLPLNIFIALYTLNESDAEWRKWPGLPYVWFASHWLAMSHSCYNPIIYCYMNTSFRHGFKQALDGLKLCLDPWPRHHSSICEEIPMMEIKDVKDITRRSTIATCGSRLHGAPRGSSSTSVRAPRAASAPARVTSHTHAHQLGQTQTQTQSQIQSQTQSQTQTQSRTQTHPQTQTQSQTQSQFQKQTQTQSQTQT